VLVLQKQLQTAFNSSCHFHLISSVKADFHCCVFHAYVYARKTLNPNK
jgi:hypothetical protein